MGGFEKFEKQLPSKENFYPRVSKISKVGEYLNQCLTLLYNCVPRLSQFLSIDKLLKNANAVQLGIGKYSSTSLYSDTTKPEIFFAEKKTIKSIKTKKRSLFLIKLQAFYQIETSPLICSVNQLYNVLCHIYNMLF